MPIPVKKRKQTEVEVLTDVMIAMNDTIVSLRGTVSYLAKEVEVLKAEISKLKKQVSTPAVEFTQQTPPYIHHNE